MLDGPISLLRISLKGGGTKVQTLRVMFIYIYMCVYKYHTYYMYMRERDVCMYIYTHRMQT